MTYLDVIQSEEVLRLRPQVEAANLNWDVVVTNAYYEANQRQYIAKVNPDQSEIIAFVVNFILGILKENVKPKRKGCGIFWNAVFSIVPQFLKKKK